MRLGYIWDVRLRGRVLTWWAFCCAKQSALSGRHAAMHAVSWRECLTEAGNQAMLVFLAGERRLCQGSAQTWSMLVQSGPLQTGVRQASAPWSVLQKLLIQLQKLLFQHQQAPKLVVCWYQRSSC